MSAWGLSFSTGTVSLCESWVHLFGDKVTLTNLTRLITKYSFKMKSILSKGTLSRALNKVMKSRDLQPRLLYPAKIAFRIEGQMKSFPREGKVEGGHYHQALIICDVKETYLRKRSKL